MTERIETVVHLRPEDIQGRAWFTKRHGVDEGRSVTIRVMPRADQSRVNDVPFADPKLTGNGTT